jgi:tetratricopeptide (TPR) repeat protein
VDGLNACDGALYIDDSCAPACINAAHCLEALGHGELALEYLEKAVRKNEYDGDIIADVADVMSHYGYYEAAKNAYMNAAKLNVPSDIHGRIADFFADARSRGIDKVRIHSDVNNWRTEFEKHPDVFDLAASLLKE